MKKAWLVLLSKGMVTKAPGKTMDNLSAVLSYLRQQDKYWEERLLVIRPMKSIKWDNMYHKIWRLTNDKPLGTPKSSPKRLSLSSTAADELPSLP